MSKNPIDVEMGTPVEIAPGTYHQQFSFHRDIEQLKALSQPGYVLLAATELDKALRAILLVSMRDISNNKAKDLFAGHGPLYHLSPKIDIAYAFKLIDEDLYNDLRIIKEIRNKFAHPEGRPDFKKP